MNKSKTITEAQCEIATALQHLPGLAAQLPNVLKPLVEWLAPPRGTYAQVSLRYGNLKKNRQAPTTKPAEKWAMTRDLAAISYVRESPTENREMEVQNPSNHTEETFCTVMNQEKVADVSEPRAAHPVTPDPLQEPSDAGDPLREVVSALAKAASDPQLRFNFISLKWFRDTYLPQLGYAWATTPEQRKSALVQAINRKWILTGHVVNPKNPQHPVTEIKVNRSLSEVRDILGQPGAFGSGFMPIVIPGEPLSETVLRERR